MPPQLSVKFAPTQWKAEGQLATTGERHVLGALNPAYNGEDGKVIPFGRAAYLDPKTNRVTRPTAAPTAGTIVIVPVLAARFGLQLTDQRRVTVSTDPPPLAAGATEEQKTARQTEITNRVIESARKQDEIQGYPPGSDIQIEYYRTGTVVMWSEGDATMGGKVYFRHVDGEVDGLTPLFAGRVSGTEADSNVQLQNAYFAESRTGKGLIAVQIDNLMIV